MARRMELRRLRIAAGLSQEGLAARLGASRNSPYRWEHGATKPQLSLRPEYARLLGITLADLDVLLGTAPESTETTRKQVEEWDSGDDMIRREFFRLAAVTSAIMATPDLVDSVPSQNLPEHNAINTYLWRVYARTPSKAGMYPAITEQVSSLRTSLAKPQTQTSLRQLCALLADAYQLAGEIGFDSTRYGDATSCYLMAANAAKESANWDLGACAMTRHALTVLAEGELAEAESLLEVAGRLARRGDSALSTRHWVAAIQAETHARSGNSVACQRALDQAEEVQHLTGQIHNGGWLRFDGSRIDEERGACFVHLGLFDEAEAALTQAMVSARSPRRMAAVRADMATLGLHRRDLDQVTEHANALVDLAAQNTSGYITAKLNGLRRRMVPLRGDTQIRELYDLLTAATD